jgi:fumarate hydratase, class II
MGAIDVVDKRLWGAQTERSRRLFDISSEEIPAAVVRAIVLIKRASAEVNGTRGLIPDTIATAIVQAADEVLAGKHPDEFPLRVWQTGSGTHTHMNVNEVLANRASEILGGVRGTQRLVHAIDHVNRGQSSNDVFPTALHVATLQAILHHVLPALTALESVVRERGRLFRDVVKLGRTHLQDALPLTLEQEFSGYGAQLAYAHKNLTYSAAHLHELALGGTAVGTGFSADPQTVQQIIAKLARWTGIAFVAAPNRFEALASSDGVVAAHAALRSLATVLFKLASDIRLSASGPRAGLSELLLPENEPGSSMMPGKVNPTQCEALLMVCAQVMGNDVTVGLAGASGNFELNTFRPLMAYCMMQSTRMLADAMNSFRLHCLAGVRPNLTRIARNVNDSLMLVTALSSHIGYDRASEIAKKAEQEGTSLRTAAVLSGVSERDFDAWVNARAMTGSPAADSQRGEK